MNTSEHTYHAVSKQRKISGSQCFTCNCSH